jgi:hypothetical protein
MRLLAIGLVLCCSRLTSAQGAGTGALEGTVIDSVHKRPLASAVVRAARVGVDTEVVHLDTTDTRGRFRFDRIEAGRYAMTFESALLDSLEYGGRAPHVAVLAGETAQIALAIPSRETLRAAACPGVVFAGRTGALVGFIENADTDRALTGAEVLVAWSSLAVDTTSAKIAPEQWLARTKVDAAGQYRLCGVPTGEWLLVQVQHAGRAGAVVRLSIVDAVGVHVRNLSFSAEGARALGETAAAGDTSALTFTGTATLLGTVRSETGAPVAGALVAVVNAAPQVRTDAFGQYVLTRLPGGTQVVEVRQLGFRIERRAVELRAGRTTTHDIALGRAIMLDSIAIVATRLRYADFESHRKFTMRGTFIDPAEIERRRQYASYVSDMVREAPGYTVAGQGSTAVVTHGNCTLLVVIDHDMRNRTINDVAPSDVGAIELYPDKMSAPARYRVEMDRDPKLCGAIVIWTKR